jgi:hypothetical protein
MFKVARNAAKGPKWCPRCWPTRVGMTARYVPVDEEREAHCRCGDIYLPLSEQQIGDRCPDCGSIIQPKKHRVWVCSECGDTIIPE